MQSITMGSRTGLGGGGGGDDSQRFHAPFLTHVSLIYMKTVSSCVKYDNVLLVMWETRKSGNPTLLLIYLANPTHHEYKKQKSRKPEPPPKNNQSRNLVDHFNWQSASPGDTWSVNARLSPTRHVNLIWASLMFVWRVCCLLVWIQANPKKSVLRNKEHRTPRMQNVDHDFWAHTWHVLDPPPFLLATWETSK